MSRLFTSISPAEFARVLPLCRPPLGWSETLVVANSGGPDSTCLLFLLNQYLHGLQNTGTDFPRRLVSLTIDHDLQTSSKTMADHAGNIAKLLGVEHITAKLPWGEPNFHTKPAPDDKIEEIARTMRYRVFFHHMMRFKSNAVAMGHHLDDQVETMLMRLGRGAGMHGLAAMRPCRRWGMGSPVEGFGLQGMKTWVVRPLLSFGKDRILATCTENALDYVQDPTNFQPEITIRNAIRQKISQKTPVQFPDDVAHVLRTIHQAAKESQFGFGLDSSLEDLREVNQKIASKVRQNEDSVDKIIANSRLPSPPGTFMISSPNLAKIGSPVVRESLLFRIIRHVSPEPWGHPRAELGRRKESVQRLIQHLWGSNQATRSFCVGSSVLWRPVVVRTNRVSVATAQARSEELAWLAQRQPPLKMSSRLSQQRNELTMEDIYNWERRNPDEQMEVLYDLRFVIRIRQDRIPDGISKSLQSGGKLVIESRKPWYLPEIWHRTEDVNEVVHSQVTSPYEWRKYFRYERAEVLSDWVTVEYIRPMSTF